MIGLVISRIKHWNRGREHDRYRMIEDYLYRIVDGERLIVDLVSTGMTPNVVRAFVNELTAKEIEEENRSRCPRRGGQFLPPTGPCRRR